MSSPGIVAEHIRLHSEKSYYCTPFYGFKSAVAEIYVTPLNALALPMLKQK